MNIFTIDVPGNELVVTENYILLLGAVRLPVKSLFRQKDPRDLSDPEGLQGYSIPSKVRVLPSRSGVCYYFGTCEIVLILPIVKNITACR